MVVPTQTTINKRTTLLSHKAFTSHCISMDSRKPNKRMDIVKLQQVLQKWKKLTVASKSNSKSMKFQKRTLSFSDTSAPSEDVPKGYLAVCVGDDMQRFVIPTEYLGHRAFTVLLREAEEEFGFQQEGVLRLPCKVSIFKNILKAIEMNKEQHFYCSSEAEFAKFHCQSKQMFR